MSFVTRIKSQGREVTHPAVGVAAAALYDHPGGGEVQLVISPDIVDIIDITDIINVFDIVDIVDLQIL